MMTQTELDKLAEMCGGKKRRRPESGAYYFLFPGKIRFDCDYWHPESSHDDCRPLLDEIEHQGLWERFFDAIDPAIIGNLETYALARDYGTIIAFGRTVLYSLKPADIVAAFQKTMKSKGNEDE